MFGIHDSQISTAVGECFVTVRLRSCAAKKQECCKAKQSKALCDDDDVVWCGVG